MEEKMAGLMDKLKKGNEWLQTTTSIFVALTSLPFIGGFISAILGKDNPGQPGDEISNTGKGFTENIIVSTLKNELEVKTLEEFEKLEDNLWVDADRGRERLIALQVYLARLIKDNSKQQKKTNKPKKDSEAPTEETSFTELATEVGKKFVIRVLAKTTYPEQKKLLEREGAFSEMPKPKTPSPFFNWVRNNKFAAFGIFFIIIPSALIYSIFAFIASLL